MNISIELYPIRNTDSLSQINYLFNASENINSFLFPLFPATDL
jgi:hypothetical protein